MARFLTVFVIGITFAAGCQPSSMVDNLPEPYFNGPTIVPAMSIMPAPAPAPNSPATRLPSRPGLAFDAAWVPNVPARDWQWIVIHHSATTVGGAARFDREHREKGWDELGYHFVIGNGTDTRDGQVEVGSRWPKQKWGAHAKTPDNRFNDFGIGICLVGNFDVQTPSQRQMDSAARLVAYLQATYHIPSDHIIGHGSVHNLAGAGTVTDCPGRNLNVASVRRMSTRLLAGAGQSIDDSEPRTAAATELLEPIPNAGK